MLSFWEKESFLRYDFAVVGGGVLGLSTAIAIKERRPRASVVVLERGVLPGGASTRNVGFLSVSTLTEILHDSRELGVDTVLAIVAKRRDGIALLRQRLGDQAIGYEAQGGYELLLEKDVAALEHLVEVNALLREVFPEDVFRLADDRLPAFGFSRTEVKHLVVNPFDAQVHTGNTIRALLAEARRLDVVLLTGAEVSAIDEDAGGVTLALGELELRAGRAAICTGAWLRRLVPSAAVVPGRGQVLLTAPIPALPWRGTFNFDEGYFYFRNVGDRAIVGGGRHTDREAETTHEAALNPRIQATLERVLRDIVFPGRSVVVEDRWAGIMGFSGSRLPIVQSIGRHLAAGFGCNSMGLALGSVLGRETAALLA